MKRQHRLTSQSQDQEQHLDEVQEGKIQREFATVEQMLRHDALHTPVPPAIGHRLQESLGQSPPPGTSWWRRFFKRG